MENVAYIKNTNYTILKNASYLFEFSLAKQ